MKTLNIGLYRHFKGSYYFVQNIVKDAIRDVHMCYYFNVLHHEYGLFVRPVDNFNSDWDENKEIYIKDRVDNITGQTHRFEKVKSLDDTVANITTDHLVRELANRVDSPFQHLDIKGLNSKVVCTDYVIGELFRETADHPTGIYSLATFNDEDQARHYFYGHQFRKETRVFKRTFIEI